MNITTEPKVFHNVFTLTTIFCFICSPLSSFGNFIIIYGLYKHLDKTFRTPSSMLFLNLAISDFLTGFVFGSLLSADALLDVFGRNSVILDSFTFVVGGLLVFANNFTITAISFDRFIAIIKPIQYKFIVTKKAMKFIITGIWLTSLLICLLPLCISKWDFLLVYSHIHISLPLISLTYIYLAIFRSIRNQREELRGCINRGGKANSLARELEQKRMERDRHLAVTIILAMGFFCVACLPFFIGVHLKIYLDNCEASSCFSEYSKRSISSLCYFSARFMIFNTVLDPFLLYWRMPRVRKIVKVMFSHLNFARNNFAVGDVEGAVYDKKACANPVTLSGLTTTAN